MVLDSLDSLVQQVRPATKEALEPLVSKDLVVLQVTPALSVSLDGQDLLDHKVHVAVKVKWEIQDCLVSLALQVCKESVDFQVAQA